MRRKKAKGKEVPKCTESNIKVCFVNINMNNCTSDLFTKATLIGFSNIWFVSHLFLRLWYTEPNPEDLIIRE